MSKNYSNKKFRIGEVYLIKFDGVSSIQQGVRPGVIFQNNIGNVYSPNVVVLPLTSSLKKRNLPTHVFLPASETGLKTDSIVLCENPQTVSKDQIGAYLTTIPDEYLSDIATSHILASAAISYIDPRILMSLWEKSQALNNIVSQEDCLNAEAVQS